MLLEKTNWLDAGEKALPEEIASTEVTIGIKFPKNYVDILKNYDGGTPKNYSFSYFDAAFSKWRRTGVGGFIPVNKNKDFNMLYYYKNPAEFFPEGLIAFAENGGGDFICFDYRNGKDNPDPPVVYWNHEADVGKDVSFVAKNFEEFLEMLKEPEDIEV